MLLHFPDFLFLTYFVELAVGQNSFNSFPYFGLYRKISIALKEAYLPCDRCKALVAIIDDGLASIFVKDKVHIIPCGILDIEQLSYELMQCSFVKGSMRD